MDKVIKIECTGTENIDLDNLTELQGNLKDLSKENYDRLKGSIIKYGFSFPLFVWKSEGKNFIIDSHQRKKTLQKLKDEGYKIPPLPTVFINAKDRIEAKEKLLQLNSNYGKITQDGLYEFINEPDFEISQDMLQDIDLPEFDMDKFDAAFYEDESDGLEGNEGGFEIIKEATLSDLAPSPEENAIIKDKKILFEFSGGKDSSAVVLWAKHFYPDNEMELDFINMGADHVGLHTFIHDMANYFNIGLKVVTTKNMFDVILESGKWPHFNGPYCHDVLHASLDDCLKSYKASDIIIMRGGRGQERAGQTKHKESRFLSVPRMKGYIYFQPFYFTDKGVGETILKENNVPIWPGYDSGLLRTACRICPGQTQPTYACIKDKHPGVWAELLWMEKKLGPGCWQDPNDKGRGSFEELANKGHEAYLKNTKQL